MAAGDDRLCDRLTFSQRIVELDLVHVGAPWQHTTVRRSSARTGLGARERIVVVAIGMVLAVACFAVLAAWLSLSAVRM